MFDLVWSFIRCFAFIYMGTRELRILFVTHMFPPEIGAASVRIYEYAKLLADFGHEVYILTGVPNYPDGEIYTGFKNRLLTEEKRGSVSVYRTLTLPIKRKRLLFRFLGYLFLSVTNLTFLRKNIRFDLVSGWQMYIFTFITGKMISKLLGVPFISEVEDFAVERTSAVGKAGNAIVSKATMAYDRFIFEHSDGVILTTEADRQYVLEQYSKLKTGQTEVVENGVVTDIFTVHDPKLEARIRDEYGLKGKFVVSCVGNFGLTQGLDKFLQAAGLLLDDDRFRFVFVGFGTTRHILEEIIYREGLTNVVMVQQQPRTRIPYFLNISSVGVCSLEDDPSLNRSFPSRIAEYLAAGLPVLILAKGEPRRIIVDEARAGVYAYKENPAEVADVLRRLAGDPDELKAMGERGRAYAREHLERAKLADKLEAFLLKTVRGWRRLKYK
jgi:colanic acid biosynthesis glycosyl transferase WcaI